VADVLCQPTGQVAHTKLKFMVDIITLGITQNSSDWLHTVQGFVHYATRIRRNLPSWLVRSLNTHLVPVSDARALRPSRARNSHP